MWINVTIPKSGCSISLSSYNTYLLQSQNADIDIVFGALQNASIGTYTIPMQESITAAGSLPIHYTQYFTCVVSAENVARPSLLNAITAQNSSRNVQGAVQIYNPTNSSLTNTTASISLPLIVAKNESYISLSGVPGSVSTTNSSYIITWSLPYLPPRYSSTVYYTIKNVSAIQAVESAPVEFSVPAVPSVSSISIFDIGIPTAYTGQYSAITMSAMYTGTAPNNITISLVGPPSMSILNGTHTFKAVPNEVFMPAFGLTGPANSGTYIMTLYISGTGINLNRTFDLVVLPATPAVTTSIHAATTTTVPQIGIISIIVKYDIPVIAAIVAAIALISYLLVTYKKSNKPRYSRDRALELHSIKEQIKRGRQS